MKKMITGVVVAFAMQFSFAQDAAFKKDVVKYIEVSQMNDQQVSLMKEQFVKIIPADKLDDFMKEVSKSLPALNDKLADEMMKVFSHEEIKMLIEFYQSPTGKMLVKKNKEITPVMYKVGEQWGQTDLLPILMKYMEQ